MDNPFYKEAASTPDEPTQAAEDVVGEASDDLFGSQDQETGEVPAEANQGSPEDDLFDAQAESDAVQRRIAAVTKQRREAREAAKSARALAEKAEMELKEVTEKLASLQSFEPLAAAYARFEDPVAQAKRDVAMLEVLEQLAQTDRSVQAVAQKLVDEVNKRLGQEPAVRRSAPVSDTTTTTPKPAAATQAPASDPRVDAIIKREAEGAFTTATAGMKPLFVATLRKEVFADGAALHELTPAVIRERAREIIAENGLTQEDVLVKAARTEKATPSTGGRRAPASRPTKANPADAEKSPTGEEPPKSRAEYLARQKAAIAKMFGE